jgi:hypothetical protein
VRVTGETFAVSNLSLPRERISAAAQKLHKNPELVQIAFPAFAQLLAHSPVQQTGNDSSNAYSLAFGQRRLVAQ